LVASALADGPNYGGGRGRPRDMPKETIMYRVVVTPAINGDQSVISDAERRKRCRGHCTGISCQGDRISRKATKLTQYLWNGTAFFTISDAFETIFEKVVSVDVTIVGSGAT